MIFLDLDGVCCDFVGHVLNLCGSNEQRLLDEMNNNPSVHPYVALENCVNKDDFWGWINDLGSDFWASMPTFIWFNRLYKSLLKIDSVHFLTSSPPVNGSHDGKALWVERNVAKEALNDLIICYYGYKSYLAGKNRILIDDTKKNISDWNKNGGISYYFPSLQFHKRHATNRDIDDLLYYVSSFY